MGSRKKFKNVINVCLIVLILFYSFNLFAFQQEKGKSKEQQLEEMQKDFQWWPTDAKPAPVKDQEREGYWWWPTEPGEVSPWGNRGYIYVYKIIYDYKAEELPPAQPKELRPSLLIKKIIKNVKIYFDFDKADLREDVKVILNDAVSTLKRYPESSILITGNCDIRGAEAYNERLGRRRAETVKNFMLDNEMDEERIKIVSRGKLDAVAPITDLVGMQKDRNAQFMIAEVEEIMIPSPDKAEELEAKQIGEGKYIIEQEETLESASQVSTITYTVQKNDTLWKIAQKHMGSGHRWKHLYELNKDVIKNPNKLRPGLKIIIPVE